MISMYNCIIVFLCGQGLETRIFTRDKLSPPESVLTDISDNIDKLT